MNDSPLAKMPEQSLGAVMTEAPTDTAAVARHRRVVDDTKDQLANSQQYLKMLNRSGEVTIKVCPAPVWASDHKQMRLLQMRL